MSARSASAVVLRGGGTRRTMASKVSSIPMPTLADTWARLGVCIGGDWQGICGWGRLWGGGGGVWGGGAKICTLYINIVLQFGIGSVHG